MPRPPTVITSLDNARVKHVVRLRRYRERRATGLFVAEGAREVARALNAGLTPRQWFACPDLLKGDGPNRPTDVEAFDVSEPVFRKVAYREHPEGLLALFEQPRWSLELLNARDVAAPPLWLVAVGLHKPGNLGAIARSAAAAGATGVLVADAVVDAFNPNAIRASTGAVFDLPIVGAASDELIERLKKAGITRVVSVSEGGDDYTRVDLTGPCAIVVGAEDVGVPDVWLHGDGVQRVTIPMHRQRVDSLNASVAAGVLLFEAARQRGAVG